MEKTQELARNFLGELSKSTFRVEFPVSTPIWCVPFPPLHLPLEPLPLQVHSLARLNYPQPNPPNNEQRRRHRVSFQSFSGRRQRSRKDLNYPAIRPQHFQQQLQSNDRCGFRVQRYLKFPWFIFYAAVPRPLRNIFFFRSDTF